MHQWMEFVEQFDKYTEHESTQQLTDYAQSEQSADSITHPTVFHTNVYDTLVEQTHLVQFKNCTVEIE